MLQTKKIEYYAENVLLEGYYAYNNASSEKKPAVLLMHDWSGRNDFVCHKAELLAELGYVGFALDMYGKDIQGKDNAEKSALMQPFIENRNLLRQRVLAALQTVTQIEQVNAARIAAIGFCFGGLCALDLARSGAEVRGVVSVHGALIPPPANLSKHAITAKILALHGHADPLVPHTHIEAFEKEMTLAKADWQLHMYGNTLHSFTNPLANDPAFGTVYHPVADKRAWISIQNFLTEILN